MRRLLHGTIAAVALCAAVPRAQAIPQVYAEYELQEAAKTYTPALRGIWGEDLIGKLPTVVRSRVADVSLDLPLRGLSFATGRPVISNSPFLYYAETEARRVTIPILSVKFLDDLATAVAWLDSRKCEPGLAYDYAGMIGFQDPSQQPGGRFPTSLRAFGVPADVLKDPRVYDVSGKILKSAIYFMMAHEIGHLLGNHPGSAPGPAGQAREAEADAFALQVMRDIGVPPAGMVVLFWAANRYEDPSAVSSHPLSSRRLLTIAEYIRANLGAFAKLQTNPSTVAAVAADLERIGRGIDDPDVRRFERERSLAATPARLASACR